MTHTLTLLAAFLFATAFYLMLQRRLLKVLLGVTLMGHAANLTILLSANITRAIPPLITPGTTTLSASSADPLPQALILTAIVIGFALLAFLLVLLYKIYKETGAQWVSELNEEEK